MQPLKEVIPMEVNPMHKEIADLKTLLTKMQPDNWKANERRMLRMRDFISTTQRELRALAEQLETEMIAHIDLHGDIEISETERLYVGNTKTNKAIGDGQGITMAVLEAGGGNLELLTSGEGGVLASQPWKYGAVKALIGEAKTLELFSVEVKQDLKTGKAQRVVKSYDSKFGA